MSMTPVSTPPARRDSVYRCFKHCAMIVCHCFKQCATPVCHGFKQCTAPLSTASHLRLAALALLFTTALGGCTEFNHWGHVSDREGSFGINAVEISQQQPDGDWKVLGKSDGKGRWDILKHQITGGGNVRLRKQGYETLILPESDFLQQNVILMQATGDAGYGEE